MAYNILDGGEGREELLLAVIRSADPDTVCLVEADSVDVVAKLAGELKMDYVHGEGQGHAVAILSRHVIVESVNHGAMRGKPRCFVEATLRDDVGKEWVVAAVHFRARATEEREQVREGELEELLREFEGQRKGSVPHLVAGDFNANSPVQRIDPEKLAPRSREAWAAQGGSIPRRVIGRLLEAGYMDVLHAFDPAAGETGGSFTTEHPGQRVDYVFSYGVAASRIVGARVIRDGPAVNASDHFPVFVAVE